jgi:hypothetical protein
MKIRKSLAGVAAGSLALAGIAIAGAPSAFAGTTSLNTLNAEPVNQAGVAVYNNLLTAADTATLTATQVGADVQLTITMAAGPKAAFAAVGAGSYQYEFDIVDGSTVVLSGNQCQTDGSAATHTAVAAGTSYPGIGGTSTIPALVCTVTAPALGAHSYDIRNMNVNINNATGNVFATRTDFDANVNRSTDPAEAATSPGYVPTSATADWGVTSSVTVLAAPSVSVTSVTGQNAFVPAARVGDTINLSLTNMTAPITSVKHCALAATSDADASCVSGQLTINAGATNTSASLTVGTVSPAPGPRKVFVSNGVNTPNPSAVVGFLVNRTITLTPANGGAGTTTTVAGSSWNPGQNVTVDLLDGSNNVISSISGLTVGSFGSWTTTANAVTVTAAAVSVRASQTDSTSTVQSVSQNWQFLVSNCTQTPTGTPCSTQQVAKVTVAAGSLSQSATGTGTNTGATSIDFPSVTTSVSPTPVTAPFNKVTVTDARGATTGWSLTAALQASGLNEINSGSGNIPSSALKFNTIGCVVVGSGSAPLEAASAGTPVASLATAQTLCTKGLTTNAGGSTSGSYDVSGNLTLTVPAFQKVASYEGTLQVTLT